MKLTINKTDWSLILFSLISITSYSQHETTRYGKDVGNADFGSFFGYNAGNKSIGSKGNSNTAFGHKSGFNATGWVNSFFGNASGYNVTSGSRNCFFGANSGYKTSSGSFNTFTGYDAGYGNTTGSYNIAIGRSAGKNLTSGRYNIFLGRSASVGARVSGSYNIAIGDNTANELKSGEYNILLGFGAGNEVTTGSNNVFIGNRAGNYLRTGSKNVFIGFNAGYNEAGSNKLYIDNSSTSAPLIWGDFSSNTLKFNGSTQVTGAINPSGGFVNHVYLDDDGFLGGNSDDWIRINNFIELSTGNDNHGIVLREKGNSNYLSITQKAGWSYLADNNTYANYFLRGNGDDVEVKDNLKANSISTQNYNTNGGIMNISGGGYGIDFKIDTDNNSSDFYRWFGNGFERMRLTDTGRLGIGTRDPNTDLSVIGKVRGSYDPQETEYVEISHGGSHGYINTVGDGNLDFRHDGNTRMSIRSNGNVGIGVNIPSEKLEIDGAIRGNIAGGALRVQTDYGYTDLGAQNSNWSQFETDRPGFYFNKGITVNQGLISSNDEDLQMQTAGNNRNHHLTNESGCYHY